jgi:N-acetylglucosaminyldiphosphoundecaprenol N-acetyl-beta-D-mannosaminyltransferase
MNASSPPTSATRPAKAIDAADQDRIDILGVAIDRVTMAEALERIDRMVRAGVSHVVLTPNVDHIMLVQRDQKFRELYRRGDLVLADGTPVVWASRYLRNPLPERVPGSDLTPILAAHAAERGHSVYFMGGQPGAAESTARILSERHPKLRVAGHACPPVGFDRDPFADSAMVDEIRAAAPDILFVALGAPKQEFWIDRHHEALGVPVSIGIGASLDFVAGIVPRAPRWTHGIGAEWLWRLLKEPRRLWRRYLVDDLPFVGLVLRQRRRRRSPVGVSP